ncbi:MAG: hypothetical protein PHT30_04960 [Bacilli bacterium]|nr:hypothetical protein [Bacilli bacterium]
MLLGKIKIFLFGNINGKSLIGYYVISSAICFVLTFPAFVILGTFYVAIENTILVNILVWLLTIIISFAAFFIPYYLITRFVKKLRKRQGPFINGWAIAAGYLTILIVCLANSYQLNDYLFVEISGSMSGIVGLIQLIVDLSKVNSKQQICN